MNKNISRKNFIRNAAIATVSIPLGLSELSAAIPARIAIPAKTNAGPGDQLSISIFSKHLHWLNYKEMASLAKELGYDGVDLTVRAQGHVLPEHVARDLPKAVDAVRNAGLEVYTITTDIRSAEEKYAEDVLKAASAMGIRNYRMGWYDYNKDQDINVQLEGFKVKLKGLAALNEKYHIHGDYENHTGRFGGPIWDLWFAFKDLKPQWTGCQFDIRHAFVDGAEAWPINLDLIQDYLGSVTIKDFQWEKTNNKWGLHNVPLGEGMIDYPQYFRLLKKYGFQKPVSQHFEYPLGGAESGADKLSIPKDEVIAHMRSDLLTLKSLLKAAALY